MTVNEYLKLPYHYVFVKVGKNWKCTIQEWDGYYSTGKTLDDAYVYARKYLKTWIEDYLRNNIEIPLPKED